MTDYPLTCGCGGSGYCCAGHRDYFELLAKRSWIRVEERLPEVRIRVLVRRPGRFYAVAHLNPSGRWYDGMLWFDDVTHWMELPEGPRE